MIRLSPLEKNQMATPFNVDLAPGNPVNSGTRQPTFLLPEDVMDMKKMNKFASPLPRIDYVPVQDKVNSMAPELNEPKIVMPMNMLYDAMKPVGKGATVFDPFNLKCY